MNKIVIFTTLLSAILLSACGGEPCVKLSELHSEETQEKWQQKFKDCGSFECRAKVDIEYKQLEEEYANKCDSQLANLDKVEVENKCKEMKIGKTKTCSEIKEAFDKKWKESRDEVLKELASNEDANWKATVCNKGEYSLSTFTVNTDDKPIGYIMLDFVVSDNILRSNNPLHAGHKREDLYLSSDSSFFLESSGRDVKKEYKSEFIKNFSDPGASKFLKNDYGRIIVAMEKDAPLPDIHTLNGYVYSMFERELVFAVDSTWNCTEMTAKEVFEKKNLVASADAPAPTAEPDTNEVPAQAPATAQAPAGNLDAQAKAIASQLELNVMNEIRMEEGKSVGQFFSIKKALTPCKKDPDSCLTKIKPLVDESVVKYARGVIAATILLNDGIFDEQLSAKVITEVLGKIDSFDKIKAIAANSPVGREIMNADNLSDDQKKQIFNIWYLRQYPYAGEDIWKNQDNPGRTWDEYMKMADAYVTEALK